MSLLSTNLVGRHVHSYRGKQIAGEIVAVYTLHPGTASFLYVLVESPTGDMIEYHANELKLRDKVDEY